MAQVIHRETEDVHYEIESIYGEWHLIHVKGNGSYVATIGKFYDEAIAQSVAGFLNEEPVLNAEDMRKISISAAAILGVSPSRVSNLLVKYLKGDKMPDQQQIEKHLRGEPRYLSVLDVLRALHSTSRDAAHTANSEYLRGFDAAICAVGLAFGLGKLKEDK